MDLLNTITQKLQNKQKVDLTQAHWPTEQSLIIAKLLSCDPFFNNSWIILTEDDKSAYQFYYNLNFWLYFLKLENWLKTNKLVLASQNIVLALTNLIQKDPSLNIISTNSITKLPSPTELSKNNFVLKIEQSLSLINLIKYLTQHGYCRQTRIFSPGEYARRGQIVDIFDPAYPYPIRLEFISHQLSTLYYFDPINQNKITTLNAITIHPLTLPPASPSAKLNDFLSSSHLISGPDLLLQKLSLSQGYQLSWQDFDKQESVATHFSKPSFTFAKPQSLNQHIKKRQKDGWQIIVAADIDKLPKKVISITKVIKNSPYLTAFTNPKLKIELITEQEISPLSSRQRQSKNITPLLINQLTVGDYVVHRDHGIARFAGISKQTFTGYKQEFFELHYAEGDKLFVPVDKAYRLSKYIGKTRPSLHRLSGANWQTLHKRVKQETTILAAELLHQQAERQLAHSQPITNRHPWENELAENFAFTLTPDQKQALQDIDHDLAQNQPMDRLICGDVGFGKTEIALRTAFKIILAGKQVALLCPTTILAQQHLHTFQERLEKFGVRVAMLSRLTPTAQKNQILTQLAQGQIDIIIGTHRLLSPDVHFKNLGLMIIDEEQRFGVLAKEKFKKIKPQLHVLTLTATPIPRTLYLALGRVKSLSLITTPPPGKKPIKTKVLRYNPIAIKQAIEDELKKGGQIYYLYNRVSNISTKAAWLKKLIPQLRLGIAHGQLSNQQLATIMHKFKKRQFDLLLCSTIIENGLNLPNVNTLIVELADKFGLAQLYQLRGRIGRSNKQGRAYFFYHADKLTTTAKKRLQILEQSTSLGDGFLIAKQDMEIRGVGNILGKQQHGNIKAIGLNLYLQLLNEAATALSTNQPIPTDEVYLDLPVTYFIPDEVVKNPWEKFTIYQQLSAYYDITALEQFIHQQFNSLPPPLANLILLLKIKILARQLNINAITTTYHQPEDPKITIHFTKPLTAQMINKLQSKNPYWLVGSKYLKIHCSKLGKKWLTSLLDYLTLLQSPD